MKRGFRSVENLVPTGGIGPYDGGLYATPPPDREDPMRTLLVSLSLLAITFGAVSLARGGDGQPDAGKALKALQAQVRALRTEVAYLRSRETALSTYVLSNDARGQGLAQVVTRTRAAGFEANRIPVNSRKLLLQGLAAAAASIRKGLPMLTPAETALLARLAKERKAAGLGG